MCLSDAYEIKDGKQNLVCSRVCNVSADGENVTLTDLMGIRKIVPGKLKKVEPDEQRHPHRALLKRNCQPASGRSGRRFFYAREASFPCIFLPFPL